MGIIIPIIKAILWIKDNYIKRLREYHLEKAQQMVVTTCYCLIKCLTHLEILSGHLSILILLYLSALFAIAGNFFLLETFFPLVSRTPRYLPHWSFRGLLFWLFLIFLDIGALQECVFRSLFFIIYTHSFGDPMQSCCFK